MDENNWDLYAVLRFACGGPLAPPPPPPPGNDFLAPFLPQQHDDMPAAAVEGQQLAPDLPLAGAPTAVVGGGPGQGISAVPQPQPEDLPDSTQTEPLLAPPQPAPPRLEAMAPFLQLPAEEPPLPSHKTTKPSGGGGAAGSSRSKRSRRKKDNDRRVTQVMVERELDGSTPALDMWNWRKYGQKEIRGSPNVRHYYKCSTAKDCKAKKYAERCSTNPDMYIVTYIGEHVSHPMPAVRNCSVKPALKIPGVAQAPALPASATALLSTTTPALPLSPPLLEIPAVAPQQALALPAIASASLSPTPPMRSPYAEMVVEDYYDAVAVRMLG